MFVRDIRSYTVKWTSHLATMCKQHYLPPERVETCNSVMWCECYIFIIVQISNLLNFLPQAMQIQDGPNNHATVQNSELTQLKYGASQKTLMGDGSFLIFTGDIWVPPLKLGRIWVPPSGPLIGLAKFGLPPPHTQFLQKFVLWP